MAEGGGEEEEDPKEVLKMALELVRQSHSLVFETAKAWENIGSTSRRRDCHSTAPPSPFSRCFNTDGEGM